MPLVMPAPDSEGNYRWPDGSRVVRVAGLWEPLDGWGYSLRGRQYDTPEAAAEALYAFGYARETETTR